MAKVIPQRFMDWSQCPVIESDPEKVSGAWVFRGTRVTVSAILESLQDSSIDEVLIDYPSIPKERIVTLLDFLARSADPVIVAA